MKGIGDKMMTLKQLLQFQFDAQFGRLSLHAQRLLAHYPGETSATVLQRVWELTPSDAHHIVGDEWLMATSNFQMRVRYKAPDVKVKSFHLK